MDLIGMVSAWSPTRWAATKSRRAVTCSRACKGAVTIRFARSLYARIQLIVCLIGSGAFGVGPSDLCAALIRIISSFMQHAAQLPVRSPSSPPESSNNPHWWRRYEEQSERPRWQFELQKLSCRTQGHPEHHCHQSKTRPQCIRSSTQTHRGMSRSKWRSPSMMDPWGSFLRHTGLQSPQRLQLG